MVILESFFSGKKNEIRIYMKKTDFNLLLSLLNHVPVPFSSLSLSPVAVVEPMASCMPGKYVTRRHTPLFFSKCYKKVTEGGVT
jgi:hypothetical protein